MQQVTETFHTLYEVKKSTFTSYLLPYGDFDHTLKQLHTKHPKASHIVWAYRYLNEFDQIVENSTDDGEPKGCAGTPTLSHLRGNEMINSALITIRYFGGIKLGTGGMVRAYSGAAKEVINLSTLSPYIKTYSFMLHTPYSQLKRYEHFCFNHHIEFQNREYLADQVIWHLQLSKEEKIQLKTFQTSLM